MTGIQWCVLLLLKEGSKKSWDDKPKGDCFIEGGHFIPPRDGPAQRSPKRVCVRGGYILTAQWQSSSPRALGHGSRGVGDWDGRRQRQAWPAGQTQISISFLLARPQRAPPGHRCKFGQLDGGRAGSASVLHGALLGRRLPLTRLLLTSCPRLRSKVALHTRRGAGSRAKMAGALSALSLRAVKPGSGG